MKKITIEISKEEKELIISGLDLLYSAFHGNTTLESMNEVEALKKKIEKAK